MNLNWKEIQGGKFLQRVIRCSPVDWALFEIDKDSIWFPDVQQQSY